MLGKELFEIENEEILSTKLTDPVWPLQSNHVCCCLNTKMAVAFGSTGEEMNNEEMIAFNLENMKGVGILDGGATKSVGFYVLIEELIEEWHECEEAPPPELEETSIGFTFAGGEDTSAVTRAGVFCFYYRLAFLFFVR